MQEKDTTAEDIKVDETSLNEEVNEETVEVLEDIVEEEIIEEVVEENLLEKELETLKDQHQRLQAEYANYRRRTQEEKESIGLFANEKILNELIPVLDSMDMAHKAIDDKESNMYKGVELVHKNLLSTITKFGVEEIEAQNCLFDPNLHLAVMQESVEGVEPNNVVDVLQKGYKLGKKVLRPSMVKVSY